MSNPEMKAYLRSALNIAIQDEESRVARILDESSNKIAAGIEKLRPLIALIRALKEEVGEVPGLSIEPADQGHMALIYARTSVTSDSLNIGTNYAGTMFKVEHRSTFTVDGSDRETTQEYPTVEAAMAVVIDLVGKHIGAQSAQDAHGKKPKSW